MNLRKLTLLAATPWLLSLGGVAAFGEVSGDINDAAATLIGSSMRDMYNTLSESGVTLDRQRFADSVIRAFMGDTLGGYDYITAETAVRTIVNPAPKPYAEADEAAEIAWVESKASLPRAERLEDGIILQRLIEGSGECPVPGSTVKVFYAGRLSDGTIFDETEAPIDLPLNRLISGLAKAIEKMHFGGTYRVFIPPKMGYGPEAVMDVIPANSALDFTLELISQTP
ncbi:MAG: hypothetical protein HDS64_10855 [Bacteroidales bacterium]|nr:hypothetical protein [Bacteroidales bacterium]